MPVTKAALKKERQDKKRTQVNNRVRSSLKNAIKVVRKGGKKDALQKAFSEADKAAKKGIIHKNKAARIKSQLAKLERPKTAPAKKPAPKPAKKTK